MLHTQEGRGVLVHVGANVRRLRLAAGLSQVALAEKASISRRTLISLENGEANISLVGLDQVAQALGTSFGELIRDPEGSSGSSIGQIAWKSPAGGHAEMLVSVPALTQAELWVWAMEPGDRYDAQPDAPGWKELIYVVDGVLNVLTTGSTEAVPAGRYLLLDSSQPYTYENVGEVRVRFVKTIVY